MAKTGIIAAAFGLAVIVLVAIVTGDMRDQRYIIAAYTLTTAIVAVYVWSLSTRLAQARERKAAREGRGG